VSQFRAAIGIEAIPGRVLGRIRYTGRSRLAAIYSRPLATAKSTDISLALSNTRGDRERGAFITEKNHKACPRARTGIGIDANRLFDTPDNATSEASFVFRCFCISTTNSFRPCERVDGPNAIAFLASFITTLNTLARFFSFLSARCRRDFKIFREVSTLRFESLSSRGYVREMLLLGSSVPSRFCSSSAPLIRFHLIPLTIIVVSPTVLLAAVCDESDAPKRALFAIPSVALCRGETLSPSKIPVVSSARSTQRRPARLRP